MPSAPGRPARFSRRGREILPYMVEFMVEFQTASGYASPPGSEIVPIMVDLGGWRISNIYITPSIQHPHSIRLYPVSLSVICALHKRYMPSIPAPQLRMHRVRTALDRAERVCERCLRWCEQRRLRCHRTSWRSRRRVEDTHVVVDGRERRACSGAALLQRGRGYS